MRNGRGRNIVFPGPLRIRALNLLDRLHGSFWFIPALMCGAALALFLILYNIDKRLFAEGVEIPLWLSFGSHDSALALLAALAGSLITTAGVVFSITIVALAQTATNYGPRLLLNFMRDRTNQFVLGAFVSTFLYSLIALRNINPEGEEPFLPHITVSVALGLGLVCLAALIYFMHHVSISIHASRVISIVTKEVDSVIHTFYTVDEPADNPGCADYCQDDVPEDFSTNSALVTAIHSGYIQALDYAGIMRIAVENDLVIEVLRRPGDYLQHEQELFRVWPKERATRQVYIALGSCYSTGTFRTLTQDLEFPLDQLVEVAVRALSAGVNDPTTAVTCVDHLGNAVYRISTQHPVPRFLGLDSKLRMIRHVVTAETVVSCAFDHIRQNARDTVPVIVRLLEVIGTILRRSPSEEFYQPLMRQAEMIHRLSQKLPEEYDRRETDQIYQSILEWDRRRSEADGEGCILLPETHPGRG